MAIRDESCCICINLRTGSLIIGYLGAVISAITIIVCLVSIAKGGSIFAPNSIVHPDVSVKYNENSILEPIHMICKATDNMERLGKEFYQKLITPDENEVQSAAHTVLIISIILLLIVMVAFGFNVALLFGVHQRKPYLLKLWTIFAMVFVAPNIIAILVFTFIGNFKAAFITFSWISLDWNIYACIVVSSYYQELKKTVRATPLPASVSFKHRQPKEHNTGNMENDS